MAAVAWFLMIFNVNDSVDQINKVADEQAKIETCKKVSFSSSRELRLCKEIEQQKEKEAEQSAQ